MCLGEGLPCRSPSSLHLFLHLRDEIAVVAELCLLEEEVGRSWKTLEESEGEWPQCGNYDLHLSGNTCRTWQLTHSERNTRQQAGRSCSGVNQSNCVAESAPLTCATNTIIPHGPIPASHSSPFHHRHGSNKGGGEGAFIIFTTSNTGIFSLSCWKEWRRWRKKYSLLERPT